MLLQVKSICAHFCHVYAPTLPRFSWDYKLVVALMALFTIYPLKNYTHIVMIMMCVICRRHNVLEQTPASCIDDRSANWRSNEHNRREDRKQASTYKEFCKGRATELYNYCRGETTKKKYFPHFHIYFYNFLLLSNI